MRFLGDEPRRIGAVAQCKFFLQRRVNRLVLAAALGFCAPTLWSFSSFAPAEAATIEIRSSGLTRQAAVIEHERLKLRRRPLVVILHPVGGPRAHRHHRFEDLAESSQPIFLYPEPIGGEWPVAPGAAADRDLAFLHDLILRLVDQGAVDRKKIFLIGESSGGVFAYRAVCAGLNGAGAPLAGLATLGAAMPTDLASCVPPALAYIAIARKDDPRIPVAGGVVQIGGATFDALPAESTLGIFAKSASCAARRDDRPLPDRGPSRPHGVAISFSGCKSGVELVLLEGGAHADHGLERSAPAAEPNEYDGAHKVWEFLKRHGA